MNDLIKRFTLSLAGGVEAAAAVVIGLAALEAALRALAVLVRPGAAARSRDIVRVQLGQWLALALEFELAADILRTAITPTWNEIGQLAAIVVLRTVLNHFLQQEIEKASERQTASSVRPAA